MFLAKTSYNMSYIDYRKATFSIYFCMVFAKIFLESQKLL